METPTIKISSYDDLFKCDSCAHVFSRWTDDVIKDAWQKDGYNHYITKCRYCDVEKEFAIELEED